MCAKRSKKDIRLLPLLQKNPKALYLVILTCILCILRAEIGSQAPCQCGLHSETLFLFCFVFNKRKKKGEIFWGGGGYCHPSMCVVFWDRASLELKTLLPSPPTECLDYRHVPPLWLWNCTWIFKKLFYCVYWYLVGVYVCVPCVCSVLGGQKRAVDPPGAGFIGGCELPRRCWELNLSLPDEMPGLLNTKSSYSPQTVLFILTGGVIDMLQ